MTITRHRQWRAWQFGRRHSGQFSGSLGGGDDNGIFDFDGVRKLPWWGKILFAVISLSLIVLCMTFYYKFFLVSLIAPLLADSILDITIPDKEGEESNLTKDKKRNVFVNGFLMVVFLLVAFVPSVGSPILAILIIFLVGRWLFAR